MAAGKRGLLLVAIGIGLTPASLVVMLRIVRRNRDVLLGADPFRNFLKRFNAVARNISGSRGSTWGLLTHVGRRSGRDYQTPLAVHPYRNGFLVPLTYGPRTDWYRNLVAAGTGTLAWQGQTYRVERPEIVSGREPMRAWPLASRIILPLAGIHEFVWLRRSSP